MSENHLFPVMLDSEDAKAVHDALISCGHCDLALKIANKAKRSKTARKYTNALRLWDESTFAVDDEPIVSEGEDGAYVMVWQWIYKKDLRDRTNALCQL